MAINIIVRFGGFTRTSEVDVSLQNKVDLMMYDKRLYIISPNGYIDLNNTDVEFARYVKTTSRYYKKGREGTLCHRKKKGWFTPRVQEGNYPPMFNFILEDRTKEFKYISETGHQIFEVVFSEDNKFVDPGCLIPNALAEPIKQNNREIFFEGKKLGIRLMDHSTGLPITDWFPFTVRVSREAGDVFTGLGRWE